MVNNNWTLEGSSDRNSSSYRQKRRSIIHVFPSPSLEQSPQHTHVEPYCENENENENVEHPNHHEKEVTYVYDQHTSNFDNNIMDFDISGLESISPNSGVSILANGMACDPNVFQQQQQQEEENDETSPQQQDNNETTHDSFIEKQCSNMSIASYVMSPESQGYDASIIEQYFTDDLNSSPQQSILVCVGGKEQKEGEEYKSSTEKNNDYNDDDDDDDDNNNSENVRGKKIKEWKKKKKKRENKRDVKHQDLDAAMIKENKIVNQTLSAIKSDDGSPRYSSVSVMRDINRYQVQRNSRKMSARDKVFQKDNSAPLLTYDRIQDTINDKVNVDYRHDRVQMGVWFGTTCISSGDMVQIDATYIPPTMYWCAEIHTHYTVIMWDQDADYPSPRNYKSPFVHWVVVDVPMNDVERGTQLIPYKEPTPPLDSVPHQYNITLLLQKNGPLTHDRENNIEHTPQQRDTLRGLRKIFQNRECVDIAHVIQTLHLQVENNTVFKTGFSLPSSFKESQDIRMQRQLSRIMEQQTKYERNRMKNKQHYSPHRISSHHSHADTINQRSKTLRHNPENLSEQYFLYGERYGHIMMNNNHHNISSSSSTTSSGNNEFTISRHYPYGPTTQYQYDVTCGGDDDKHLIIYPQSLNYASPVGSPTGSVNFLKPFLSDASGKIMEDISI